MNDFEEFNVTPELTLDPFQEEKKETPQILVCYLSRGQ